MKFTNCEIKEGFHDSTQPEVVVKSYTGVSLSPKSFEIEDLDNAGSRSIRISEIVEMKIHDHVSVKIKVLKVKQPDVVTNGKRKQDVVIADASGSTLWEDDIGSLIDGKSYQLSKVLVQTFKERHYLSFPSTAKVSVIEDVDVNCDVIHEPPDSTSEVLVEVASVENLTTQYLCVMCNGNVQLERPVKGVCCKCKDYAVQDTAYS